MANVKFLFPFSFDEEERVSALDIELEQRERFISFEIPFYLSLEIENAKLIKAETRNKKTLYIFEFEKEDDALEWLDEPLVFVRYADLNGNCAEIEAEMNSFMAQYEAGEIKKKKTKRKFVDDEGYTYYK